MQVSQLLGQAGNVYQAFHVIGETSPTTNLAKLLEEGGALAQAVIKGKSRQEIAEEIADVLIVAAAQARAHDIGAAAIQAAITRKINKGMLRANSIAHAKSLKRLAEQ